MIIEDRAREFWAESLDSALGGGQYDAILTILTEEQDTMQPIPEHFLIAALQSFFFDPPSSDNTYHALVEMGLATPRKESPMQSESCL